MDVLTIVLSCILFVVALALIVIVLIQTDRGSRMSAVTGNTGSGFYGKNKGASKEMKRKRITVICSIVFMVLIVVVNIIEMI